MVVSMLLGNLIEGGEITISVGEGSLDDDRYRNPNFRDEGFE